MKRKLLFSCLALSAAAAQASVVFYDGFLDGGATPSGAEYNTSGSPAYLHNQNPTISPFNAAWSASNNFGTNSNAGARLETGLSYAGAPASQGAAVRMGRFGGSGSLTLHNVSRAADPSLTAASDAYYGSFMLSMNELMYGATSNTQLFTQFSFIDNLGGAARNLQIGVNASKQLFMEVQGGTNATVTSTTATMSGHTDAQLIVFQVLDRTHAENTSGGTTEQITVWLNPDFSEAPTEWANPLFLENPLLRTTVDTTNLFSGLGLYAQVNGTGHQGNFDEIRLATDWESLGVIPEPSTYAVLFGLAALGFVAWRRRRRA